MWGVLGEIEESGNRTTVGRTVHRRSSTGTAQCHWRQCFPSLVTGPRNLCNLWPSQRPDAASRGGSAPPLYGRRARSTWGSHLCQLCALVSFLSDGASYCGSGLGSLPPRLQLVALPEVSPAGDELTRSAIAWHIRCSAARPPLLVPACPRVEAAPGPHCPLPFFLYSPPLAGHGLPGTTAHNSVAAE